MRNKWTGSKKQNKARHIFLCEAAERGLNLKNNGEQETEADGCGENVCGGSELLFITADHEQCLEGGEHMRMQSWILPGLSTTPFQAKCD